MNNKEMPILLLTGYLGSGKTTLVNRILSNKKGIRFAVIVNDIGEVNIDATLIQQGGVVGQSDDSLVALQNGCICCTLKTDLMNQIVEIMKMDKFDYIVIEASGICEPEPIAQTICSMKSIGGVYTEFGTPRLDCLVTVVDALRMADEFGCGESLERKNLEEDDIENLIIQQIEFCNVILLNKASEVSPESLDKIKHIIREIQTKAQIIECDYADVDLEKLLDTNMFDYRQTESGAGWIRGLESDVHDEEHHHEEHEEDHDHHHEEHEEHEEHHHHHHDHDHEGGEVEHHHDHEEHEHHHHDGECSCGCGHHHHHDHEGHHHADEVFTSWGKETIHTYTKDEVSAILKTLEEDGSYGNVLRAKGMVAGADGEWIYFDMVPEEHEVRTGAPEYTGRICVIGAELNEDKLAELFKLK